MGRLFGGDNKIGYNPVSWMATNHVAANLLMAILVLSGLYFVQNIRQEVQPNYTYATVLVEMSYPGASPEEVEQGIVLAIEASIKSIEGISRITSTANEGSARVAADVEDGESLDRVLQSVRNAVESITSFPSDAERPSVRLDDDARWLTTIGVSGTASQEVIYDLVNRIKSDLLAMDGITQVSPRVKREPEISIEIPQHVLRSLDLTLPQVAQKVGFAAKDIPGGDIETQNGQYILRTEGRRDQGIDFNNIALKSDSDGSVVTLGDVAQIRDGLKQSDVFFSYNGSPGMIIYVYQTKNSRTVDMANQVQDYVAQLNASLPDSVQLDLPYNRIERYKDRMSMLVENGVVGLLLVVLVLGIFLNPRLAFWVAVSIPLVFISSFTVLSYLDVSVNMISMFAFIMTLGIVVDDAIIVGENIYSKIEQGIPAREAVIEGANDMVIPVLFAVGTNIIAFIPMLLMPGDMGNYLRSLPIVAMVVFTVSLVEALFILPAHLNSQKNKIKWPQFLQRTMLFRQRVASSLDYFRDNYFATALKWCTRNRYSTLVLFTGGVALMFTWFYSDRIDFRWYPRIPSDSITARLTMPADASVKQTIELSKYIEAKGIEALQELGSLKDVESRSVTAGLGSSTSAKISFNLVSETKRDFNQSDFVHLWRDKVGTTLQVKRLTFDYLVGFGSGAGVFVDMRHSNTQVLETAAKELAATMKTIEGMVDITDGLAQGKNQLKYSLTDEAKSLGITEDDFGRQLRAAFFGDEALRMLRDADQVKVWVRLPKEERNSLNDLDDFVIKAPNGVELPLYLAATVENSRTFTAIDRENGRRNISVGGAVDPQVGSNSLITGTLDDDILPKLIAKYPGLVAGMSGSLGARSGQSTMSVIGDGLALICILIFALVASLFRSYTQGLIVMMTIPFCMAAAVAGHIVMGYGLTSNSMFGMVALAGMVVNGALVLTTRMNDLVVSGMNPQQALYEGAISRFRPIVLTALTTTAGLIPMLFETSQQALYLVPFAIALSFGTVFSAFVVLLLIPALHSIHLDFQTLISNDDSVDTNSIGIRG